MSMLVLSDMKVQLRSIKKKDIKVLWELIYPNKNPEWKKWDAPYYPLEFMAFDNFNSNFNSDNKLAIWVDNRLIGTVTYYWEHKPSNWLEVGISIYSPSYWSNGYGTKALKLWIGYLFQTLPLVRVGLTTWSGNLGMMRCAEKSGMKQEACLRKCRLWQDTYYDSIRYGILREEWDDRVSRYNKQ